MMPYSKEKKIEYDRKWRAANREKVRESNKRYCEANPEKRLKSIRKYSIANHKKIYEVNRIRRESDPEGNREYQRQYREANRGRLRTNNQAWAAAQRANNPSYRIKRNLRTRINGLLRGYSRLSSTMELVGCTIVILWKHLEVLFLPGMTRENYGLWHVDHIRPCASFDLTDPEQQKQCFHYTNLQPLWAHDNAVKYNNYSIQE